jgi:uncharacterized membrane protein
MTPASTRLLQPSTLLNRKEVADTLRRSPGYVSAMKAAGFVMPGGLTTFEATFAWLAAHPKFTRESVYPTRHRNKPERPGTTRNTGGIARLRGHTIIAACK